jgi:hypothetical protein
MKQKMKYILLIPAIIFTVVLHAQPPAGKAKKGNVYGQKVDPSGAAPVSSLASNINRTDTTAVKVKGKVLDVCHQKGCWMTMMVNDSTEAFVKMKDYGFFVPVDLQGKMVVLDGISFIKTTSVEELKHYAEDGKKTQAEIDAIKTPEKQIRLLASGIVVVE